MKNKRWQATLNSEYSVEVFLKSHVALAYFENTLITYSKGKLFCVDVNNKKKYLLTKIRFKKKYFQFFSSLKLLSRIFRLQARAFCVENKTIFFVLKGIVYSYSLSDNILKEEKVEIPFTGTPLYITSIKDINGVKPKIVFGEYFNNSEKLPIRIFARDMEASTWRVIYTFPMGTINHVHQIIPDKINNRVWVLTGDCNECSSIWYTEDDFNTLKKFIGGAQEFRACVGFPTKNGFLYATDSPDFANRIVHYKFDKTSTVIKEINGSVIYGRNLASNRILSTTIEPREPKNGKVTIKYLLTRKLGKGIKNNYACLYIIDSFEVKKLFSAKKDLWPMVLMQFGLFTFPGGEMNDDLFFVNAQALKKIHNSVLLFKRKNI